MKKSSLHRIMGVVLMALVVIGFLLCRESRSAEEPTEKAVPADAKPGADVPLPDDRKQEMAKKVDGDRGDAEVGLDALIAPFQELFGLGARGQGAVAGGVMILEDEQGGNAPAGAEDDPMMMQFMQQHQSSLKAELRFARLICSDLAVEQRPKVRSAAENSLKQFARGMAKQQNQMQRGIAVNQMNQQPVRLIREAIMKALKEVLPEDQIAIYQDETQKRIEIRKRAVILNVVSLIDGKLFLDQEQRGKVEQSITARWQEDWDRWSMYSQFGGQYVPPVPDECVVHCLNSEQKKVWGGLQRVEFGWWGNDNPAMNQDDDQWWGVEANGGPANNAVNFQQIFIAPAN